MSWTTVLGVLSAKCTQAYTYKYSKMRHFGSVKQRLPPSLLKDPQDKLGKSRRCLFGFVSDIYLGERFAYFAHNYMSVKGESHFPELLFVGLFFHRTTTNNASFCCRPMDAPGLACDSSKQCSWGQAKKTFILLLFISRPAPCFHSAGKCCPCRSFKIVLFNQYWCMVKDQ